MRRSTSRSRREGFVRSLRLHQNSDRSVGIRRLGLTNKPADHRGQLRFITIEAGDHGVEHCGGIKFFKVKRLDRRSHHTCDGNSGLAIGMKDRLAKFFSRQTLTFGFCGPLFHSQLQLNAFNCANLLETGAADDETRSCAFPGWLFLLWHL